MSAEVTHHIGAFRIRENICHGSFLVFGHPAAGRFLAGGTLDPVAVGTESFVDTVKQSAGNGDRAEIGFHKHHLIFVGDDTDDDPGFALRSVTAEFGGLAVWAMVSG